jgi:hypothetical protein
MLIGDSNSDGQQYPNPVQHHTVPFIGGFWCGGVCIIYFLIESDLLQVYNNI